MQYAADSPEAYIAQVPEDRRPVMEALRNTIRKHLPKGFSEAMSYGMIGYVVPHAVYPPGYHCDPKLPLPFLSIAWYSRAAPVFPKRSGAPCSDQMTVLLTV